MSRGARFHSDATYRALKAAARMAIREAGGLESAAAVTRVERSSLSRYEQPGADLFMPADVMLDLDAANGVPHLTRELARRLGHVLIELPRLDGTGVWGRHLGDVAKECGEAIAVVGAALSVGGTITAEEVRGLDILREVDEAIERLVVLKAALTRLEQDEGKGA